MQGPRITVNADGTQANAVFNQINSKANALATSIGGPLKAALIGFFSVTTIKAAVSAMAQFADEVQNAADKLQISVEQVQLLRTAARHAGSDLGTWEKIFGKMDKNRADALRNTTANDAKIRNAATQLGLSEDDLANKNGAGKVGFIQKALRATEGMAEPKAQELLDTIFGKNAGREMLAQKADILSPYFNAASADMVAKMDELADAYDDLKENITRDLLPAFVKIVEWINSKIKDTKETNSRSINEKVALEQASLATGGKGGMFKSFIDQAAVGRLANEEYKKVRKDMGNLSAKEDAELYRNVREEVMQSYVKNKFGQKGLDKYLETLGKFETQDAEKKADEEKRDKAKAEARRIRNEMRAKGGAIDPSEGIPVKGEQRKLLQMPGAVSSRDLATTGLARIGGFGGENLSYRMQRINNQSLEYQKRTAENTKIIAENLKNKEAKETPTDNPDLP